MNPPISVHIHQNWLYFEFGYVIWHFLCEYSVWCVCVCAFFSLYSQNNNNILLIHWKSVSRKCSNMRVNIINMYIQLVSYEKEKNLLCLYLQVCHCRLKILQNIQHKDTSIRLQKYKIVDKKGKHTVKKNKEEK